MGGRFFQFRPGVFAMEGDERIEGGALHRFSDGAWGVVGDPGAEVAPTLTSHPLPAERPHRTTGPVDFRSEH